MMITAGRFVFFEIRSYPTEDFSNRPNPSSKILTSGDGAIGLPGTRRRAAGNAATSKLPSNV